MKKIISILAIMTSIGFISVAQATEHCPKLHEINETGSGVFSADGENGKWSGVLQGIIGEKNPVQSFKMSIAIQESESTPLKFQYCTYNINTNKTLDMRFTPKNEKEFTIKTEGNGWTKESGNFGLIYNVCENTSPENCIFKISQ
ncbi:DUF3757 domain-containing protein [Providencia sp.]|uniref:DUF3757 domain-containing protein n=1 Tax=Providencia sp. TaxID=589 RepID=UPI000E9C43D8|nr:DUF3757 domain-containing protein [Providencia sp.]MBP6081822.1 DUF3757 domain-containing protein [Providencia sp.]HBO23523.1 hypothetical protein [Providencia sp.]